MTVGATSLPSMAYYLYVARSGRLLVTALAALGAVSGLAIEQLQPERHRDEVAVELTDLRSYVDLRNDDRTAGRVTVDTTAQLVKSQPVIEAVARATGVPETEAGESIGVSAYPLSRVLIVSFESSDPGVATAGATAAADAMLEQRASVLAGAKTGAVQELRREQVRLRSRLTADSDTFPALTRRLSEQIDHLERLLLRTPTSGGRIIQPATGARQQPTHPERSVVTGLVSGLMAGFAVSWWRQEPVRTRRPISGAGRATVRPRTRSAWRWLPRAPGRA